MSTDLVVAVESAVVANNAVTQAASNRRAPDLITET